MSDRPWTRYYECAGEDPRGTLLDALDRFEREKLSGGFAVDLGCGTGRDTVELLRRGWRVLAIDAQREALERLEGRCGDESRLSMQLARFEEATWPDAHLITASYSLPFCPPGTFPRVWERITASLLAGGRFAGQLFGDRDSWATGGASRRKSAITFVQGSELDDLVRPFEVERLDEVEEDGKTAVGDPKHWHLYHLVLRKP
jgi:tellurite methyltransferase